MVRFLPEKFTAIPCLAGTQISNTSV